MASTCGESLPADASSELDDGDVSTLLRHTDDRRRAQFLAPILLLLTFAIPVMYVAVIWVDQPATGGRRGLCLTTFGCWIALRRGYLTPASTVFSIALVAALLLPPAFTGTAGLSPTRRPSSPVSSWPARAGTQLPRPS